MPAQTQRPRRSPVAMIMLVAAIGLAFVFGRDALAQPPAGRASVPEGSEFASHRDPLPVALTATLASSREILVAWDAADDPTDELYAVMVGNLAGRFGTVRYAEAATVDDDDLAGIDLAVYVNSDENSPVAVPLLDALEAGADTLWIGGNLDQIEALIPEYFDDLGWSMVDNATSGAPDAVHYKGTELPRDPRAGTTPGLEVSDQLHVLATASAGDRNQTPYAVRTNNLTWLAEAPFSYASEADRGLVLADLLIAVLEPDQPERHRGMVRLEDVGPWADPDRLVVIADELAARGVPFSVAVYPIWMDPLGHYDNGNGIRLADRPAVVDALEHMESVGGTLLMHGITHQLGEGPNPYEGVSGEDFEFYVTHVDEADNVVYDGPPAQADREWIEDRVSWGFAEFDAAGLDPPTIFEFPHYAAHWEAYEVIEGAFEARYERTMYFGGLLSGSPSTAAHDDQWFPYPVVDFYGELVIPENMGNYIEVGYNNNSARGVDELLDNARRVAVVTDSVSSMFFHPYLDPEPLLEVVDQMIAEGFEFVGPDILIEETLR